jgi:hypothetical protein
MPHARLTLTGHQVSPAPQKSASRKFPHANSWWSQWVDATPSNIKLLLKGGVYGPRETGGAFSGAADRAMEPLEGGAVAAHNWARLRQATT